jgi:hypothetical protein
MTPGEEQEEESSGGKIERKLFEVNTKMVMHDVIGIGE